MAFTRMRLNRSKPGCSHLFVALLVASVIRLVYIAYLDPEVHWPDERDYIQLSENLAKGRGYTLQGQPTAFRAPGYPLFLAPWSFLEMWSVTLIRVLHVLLGAVIMVLAFMLTRRFFSTSAANVVVWIISFYPYYIFLTGTVLSEVWFMVLLLGCTFLLLLYTEKKSQPLILVSGLLMGAAVLTRPSALALALAAVLWILTVKRKLSWDVILLFILGLFVVVFPWTLRNKIVFNTFDITLNTGRNLWLGNNEQTTINSGSDIPMPPDLQQVIEKSSEPVADDIYKQRALSFIKKHPVQTVELWAGKGLALWRPGPSPTTEGYTKQGTCIRLASYLSYVPVFILAVCGWFMADREKRKIMRLWIFYALAFTVLHAVFISKVRFRLPLDIFLMIMAAFGILEIYRKIVNKYVMHKT